MINTYKIELPMHVFVGKKRFSLNLNTYRNSHFFVLNNAKIAYKKSIQDKILKVFENSKIEKCKIDFVIYPQNKRLFDLDNCVIVSKFFLDTLKELAVIADDNYTIVTQINFRVAEIDKLNARCEAIVTSLTDEITHEGINMKITMSKDEAIELLKKYCFTQDANIEIDIQNVKTEVTTATILEDVLNENIKEEKSKKEIKKKVTKVTKAQEIQEEDEEDEEYEEYDFKDYVREVNENKAKEKAKVKTKAKDKTKAKAKSSDDLDFDIDIDDFMIC